MCHTFVFTLVNEFLSNLSSLFVEAKYIKREAQKAPEIKRKSDKVDTTRVLTLNERECA